VSHVSRSVALMRHRDTVDFLLKTLSENPRVLEKSTWGALTAEERHGRGPGGTGRA